MNQCRPICSPGSSQTASDSCNYICSISAQLTRGLVDWPEGIQLFRVRLFPNRNLITSCFENLYLEVNVMLWSYPLTDVTQCIVGGNFIELTISEGLKVRTIRGVATGSHEWSASIPVTELDLSVIFVVLMLCGEFKIRHWTHTMSLGVVN